jgi:hypothetical protein
MDPLKLNPDLIKTNGQAWLDHANVLEELATKVSWAATSMEWTGDAVGAQIRATEQITRIIRKTVESMREHGNKIMEYAAKAEEAKKEAEALAFAQAISFFIGILTFGLLGPIGALISRLVAGLITVITRSAAPRSRPFSWIVGSTLVGGAIEVSIEGISRKIGGDMAGLDHYPMSDGGLGFGIAAALGAGLGALGGLPPISRPRPHTAPPGGPKDIAPPAPPPGTTGGGFKTFDGGITPGPKRPPPKSGSADRAKWQSGCPPRTTVKLLTVRAPTPGRAAWWHRGGPTPTRQRSFLRLTATATCRLVGGLKQSWPRRRRHVRRGATRASDAAGRAGQPPRPLTPGERPRHGSAAATGGPSPWISDAAASPSELRPGQQAARGSWEGWSPPGAAWWGVGSAYAVWCGWSRGWSGAF